MPRHHSEVPDHAGPSGSLDLVYVGRLPPIPDGTAIVAAQVLPGLRALGHRLRALAPIAAELAFGDQDFTCLHPDIPVTRYEVPGLPSSFPRGSWDEGYRRAEASAIARLLPALIAQERPDVVLVGLEGLGSHVLPVATAHRIPTLQVVHGSFALRALLRGAVEAEGLLPRLRQATRLVTVARHLAESLGALGLGDLEVIPNPVDLERFRPGLKPEGLLRELAIGPDRVVVLYAAHMHAVKRPLDVVGSASRAVRADPRLVYVVMGTGEGLARVEEACRAGRLEAHFRFVGRTVEHARMPDYFNLADMVVVPSESEGQSLVSLEAQACARLLVASDIPAARELVVHGETGLLFAAGDVEDFAAKTILGARSPRRRAAIAGRGRARVQAHALSAIVRRYESALRETARHSLERRPPGGDVLVDEAAEVRHATPVSPASQSVG